MRNQNTQQRRRRRTVSVVGLTAAILATAAVVVADTVVLHDGRAIEGRVLSEAGPDVTVEYRQAGMLVKQTLPREQVLRIDRPVHDGPGYCLLPMKGVIGRHVTARALREGLDAARQARAELVILVIDSDGGDIAEMSRIIQALHEVRDVKVIALVRRGVSAAGMIATSCPRVFVTPTATIGAAVPWRVGPDGTPENVERKFESAYGAFVRASAERAGHSPLLVRGMIEAELELSLTPDGKVVDGAIDGAKLIKPRGRILTLTGAEAVECGLAERAVESMDDLRQALGLEKWHDADPATWTLMEGHARQAARQVRQADERSAYVKAKSPEVERLTGEFRKLEAELRRLDTQANEIVMGYSRDMEQLNAERDAAQGKATSPAKWAKQNDAFHARAKLMREAADAKLAEVNARRVQVERDANALAARIDRIAKDAPAGE